MLLCLSVVLLLLPLPFSASIGVIVHGCIIILTRWTRKIHIGAFTLKNISLCPHRNLLSLKHYEGNVEDLDLNFTTISSEFGQSKVQSVSWSLIIDRTALMESLL